MAKEIYKEILVLKEKLDKANVPYYLEEFMNGYRLAYPSDSEVVCSVIEHDGSYGKSDDLLEIYGLLTDEENEFDCVLGFLSAEEVYTRILKHYKNNK